jgi:DNA modification methylase
MGKIAKIGNVSIYLGDSSKFYGEWDAPTVIVSDGPYGLSSFEGDPHTHKNLAIAYEPHIKLWSSLSTPQTTLWFWNSEIGWATVHPILEKYGWEYRNCNIWDKGIGHIAGNANSKTLRKFPVVTEVCVQYVKKPIFYNNNVEVSMQDWLRQEWKRTTLPFYLTNEACGVKNAATRKYFTADHLWYFPPTEMFEKIVSYANKFGAENGKPYFSLNGIVPISGSEWDKMRSKFYCGIGITNVWQHPSVRGNERIKDEGSVVHMNQKPLKLLEQTILASSDINDVVWEPFGGLCSVAIAALKTNRKCYSAELHEKYYKVAVQRLRNEYKKINHQLEKA